MRSLYHKIFVLLLAATLLFSACSRTQSSHNFEESLYAAVADGYLMSVDTARTAAGHEPTLIEIIASDGGVQEASSPATARLLTHADLSFQHVDRLLNDIYVEQGQIVSAGDVLASTIFEPPEILLAQQRLLQQEIARFESNFSIEQSRIRSAIEELRISLAVAADNEWERYSLRLSLYELRLEYFLLNSRRERESFRSQQAYMDDMLEQEQLIAPFCGVITFAATILPGSTIPEGQRIVSIADTSSLFFTVPVTPNVLIRYGDIFPLVVPDMTEFYVRVINDNFAAGLGGSGIYYLLAPVNQEDMGTLLYAMDYDWLRLNRITIHIFPTWNMPDEGIRLPMRNIRWDAYRPFVMVYENGSIGRRFITIAESPFPTRYVYIISGLEHGQWVVEQ